MKPLLGAIGLALGTLLAMACGSSRSSAPALDASPADASPIPWTAPKAMPEIPAYTPYDANVLLVKDGLPTVPVFPPYRASADARVTISSIGIAFKFHLFRPEAYSTSFSASPPGLQMVEPTKDVALAASSFESHLPASDGYVAFRTVCDSVTNQNPKPCAADASMDCYDLTVIAAYRYSGMGVRPFELWSTPIAVSVKYPKTEAAFIATITPGTPVKSPTTFEGAAFNELSTTDDGRLLVGDTRGTTPGSFTIVYSVNPPGSPFPPCDARGWTKLTPVSKMFSDPDMKPYGVAAYPLRDTEGALIAPGANLNAIYPWLDRKGRNLCFTTYCDPLYYVDSSGNARSRYPVKGCAPGVSCPVALSAALVTGDYEDQAHRQGVACAGLWTHGKAVILNGRLNNGDFGLGMHVDELREVSLYEDHTGKDRSQLGQVLVGNNFYGLAAFVGGANNSAFLDSIEHRYNFLPNLLPLSFARSDVVWIVASGKTTQEVAFDPFVNPSSFIVSSGLASVSNDGPDGPGVYHDGFVRAAENNFSSSTVGKGLERPPHILNAATAVSPEVVAASGGKLSPDAGRWRIPAFGLAGSDVRIEPINAGGVAGIERGLWLSGEGSVRYDVPAQPDAATLASTPWYAGIFLDTRPAKTDTTATVRRILTFPDGSVLELEGLTALRFGRPSKLQTADVPVPAPAVDWVHVAVLSTPSSLRFYEDGFLFLEVDTKGDPLFRIAEGTLTVGEADGVPGFRGWMDRFEVYADAPNAEVLCNRAMGTLVGLSATRGALHDKATKFPSFAHDAVRAMLPAAQSYPLYACYADYSSEFGANLNNVPPGAVSLRTTILFPEGPMVWDRPRPGSSKNEFCLGCHVADQPPTLQPAALAFDAALTEFADPRRRPMQPVPSVFGNVPAGFLGPATPPSASGSGLNVDMYLYPAKP